MVNGLLSQVSYICNHDSSLPPGVVAFRITASGNSGETWTVSNVSNLYSNIDPDILVSDGDIIPEDPMDPGKYRLTGYAYDGIMPYATVMRGNDPVIDMNMITCMSPKTTIIGDMDLCLGSIAQFTATVSNPNLIPSTVEWSTNGAISYENTYGPDNLNYDVRFTESGDHLVYITGETTNGFKFNANAVVSVHDIAKDYVIDGPMYLCFNNNENVKYSVNNPDTVSVSWSSVPGVNMITPLTGSGSMVEVDFPDIPGIYTLSIANTDPNGCAITQVIKPVEIVAIVDTVEVHGDVHVCLDQTETYYVDAQHSNVSWTVVPGDPPGSGGFIMDPATGSGSSIQVTYTESGTYNLIVSGDSPDGCPFQSTLAVTVPGDDISSLACNNVVNVSLNNTCVLELFPDMILEGDFDMNEAFQLEIVDAVTGEVLDGNMVTQDQLGHTFMITVTQECGGNSCWGTLVVEDKSITDLSPYCPGSASVTCFDFADKSNPAGFPNFPPDVVSVYRPDKDNWLVSGFDNCSDVILSYVDTKLSQDECTDHHILRTWTAVDINNGLSSSCSVDIHIGLVDKSSIIWPPNWDSGLDDDMAGDADTDNTFGSLDACDLNNPPQLLCQKWLDNKDSNGNPSPACTGEPQGLLCSNLQLIGYKDQLIPICGNSKKILRKWSVWDACTNEDVLYTQIITIMDNTKPECQAPKDKTYYTDTHECGGDILVDPPIVTNECAGWSYDVEYKVGNYNDYNDDSFVDGNITWDPHTEKYTIHNVNFEYDSIWIRYIITDICGNKTEECIGEFELLDDEQPIPACDLHTSIALNNGGLAYAGPSSFDDHSWDNCGVFTKLIQRMDESECHCYERKLDFMHPLGEYNGHYYYLSKYKYNGRRAYNFAEALDGYVAVIDSSAENTWLRNAVSQITEDPYYIGLKGNTFNVNQMYWDNDNNDYNFNGHWASNEPFPDENYRKGDVFVVVNKDGEWEAERQTGLKTYYVVEFETKCGWSQQETFCCADLGEETMVSMRVIDFEGNHNFCMVNVEVQDFSPPRMVCPANVEIDCSTPYDLDDLSAYGYATAIDDCEVEITDEAGFIGGNCGTGQIIRTFTATDGVNDVSCNQIISLVNGVQLIYDSIYWPADTLVTDICTLEDFDPGVFIPTWNEDAFPCSSIIYTYDDLLFKIVEGACQKLVRTWTIIDWCNPYQQFTHDQVIKLMNTNGPVLTSESCQTLNVPDGNVIGQCLVQLDDLVADVIDTGLGCGDHLKWSYTVDYNSNGSIDVSAAGNDASGAYPYGNHILTWIVEDECNNVTTCTKSIQIKDNKAPTPYCHGQIVIPVNSEEGVDIWVSDIDLYSVDDCINNPVTLSFDENDLETSYNISCDNILDGETIGYVLVDMWVWDNPNPSIANKSYCTVTIQVQDNLGICSGMQMGMIAGNLVTESYEMIENVEMNIMANNPDFPKYLMSDDGEFAFEDVVMHEDYTISAIKDDDYLNGVSTLDLVIIQRHILGIDRLDSPYQLIAADINDSDDISAIDLIELRKLILGIYEELPDNNSWRFVVENYQFPDPLAPWSYDEVINIEDFDTDILDANFMGVKIGDVNGSVTSSINGRALAERSNESFEILLRQSVTEKGNTRIQLIANSQSEVAGLQFSLGFDTGLTDLIAAIPMGFDIGNENIAWQMMDAGSIVLSWNNSSNHVNKGDVLMEFLFEGNHKKPILQEKQNLLTSEIYMPVADDKIQIKDIHFRSTSDFVPDFDVSQNIPNPFNELTVIGFSIEKDGPVKFTVTDNNGRLIYDMEENYVAGYNEIILKRSDLNTTGILYYTISTSSHSSTRKMIVLR